MAKKIGKIIGITLAVVLAVIFIFGILFVALWAADDRKAREDFEKNYLANMPKETVSAEVAARMNSKTYVPLDNRWHTFARPTKRVEDLQLNDTLSANQYYWQLNNSETLVLYAFYDAGDGYGYVEEQLCIDSAALPNPKNDTVLRIDLCKNAISYNSDSSLSTTQEDICITPNLTQEELQMIQDLLYTEDTVLQVTELTPDMFVFSADSSMGPAYQYIRWYFAQEPMLFQENGILLQDTQGAYYVSTGVYSIQDPYQGDMPVTSWRTRSLRKLPDSLSQKIAEAFAQQAG